jgi:hypothetical protein
MTYQERAVQAPVEDLHNIFAVVQGVAELVPISGTSKPAHEETVEAAEITSHMSPNDCFNLCERLEERLPRRKRAQDEADLPTVTVDHVEYRLTRVRQRDKEGGVSATLYTFFGRNTEDEHSGEESLLAVSCSEEDVVVITPSELRANVEESPNERAHAIATGEEALRRYGDRLDSREAEKRQQTTRMFMAIGTISLAFSLGGLVDASRQADMQAKLVRAEARGDLETQQRTAEDISHDIPLGRISLMLIAAGLNATAWRLRRQPGQPSGMHFSFVLEYSSQVDEIPSPDSAVSGKHLSGC